MPFRAARIGNRQAPSWVEKKSAMNQDRPQLRYVDAIPVEQEGQPYVVIRDPEELLPEPIVVPLPTFFIMTLLDGARELRDVQAEIQRQFGELIPLEYIQKLVEELDGSYLLVNERALIRREEMERDFSRMPVRRAAHAGSAYPEDPEELIKACDEWFGSPRQELSGPAAARDEAPTGLVTPHIDLRVGGALMAQAFRRLAVADPPKLFIILGVAHHATPNLYTLTDKDFETPLGIVAADKAAAQRLRELYGEKRLRGEYAHKLEHSVEFQVVFLKYLLGEKSDFTILPILCGSLHEELEAGDGGPRQRAEVVEFCAALRKLIEESGRKVCVIAGVDLSHVGKKFGDANGVDDFRAELIRAGDLRMLETVAQRDPEAFFDHFRPDQNARNVDAVSAVYTMLSTLGGGQAELLGYEQFREDATESLVSFASMALY